MNMLDYRLTIEEWSAYFDLFIKYYVIMLNKNKNKERKIDDYSVSALKEE